jgi:hypothetical protein
MLQKESGPFYSEIKSTVTLPVLSFEYRISLCRPKGRSILALLRTNPEGTLWTTAAGSNRRCTMRSLVNCGLHRMLRGNEVSVAEMEYLLRAQ